MKSLGQINKNNKQRQGRQGYKKEKREPVTSQPVKYPGLRGPRVFFLCENNLLCPCSYLGCANYFSSLMAIYGLKEAAR